MALKYRARTRTNATRALHARRIHEMLLAHNLPSGVVTKNMPNRVTDERMPKPIAFAISRPWVDFDDRLYLNSTIRVDAWVVSKTNTAGIKYNFLRIVYSQGLQQHSIDCSFYYIDMVSGMLKQVWYVDNNCENEYITPENMEVMVSCKEYVIDQAARIYYLTCLSGVENTSVHLHFMPYSEIDQSPFPLTVSNEYKRAPESKMRREYITKSKLAMDPALSEVLNARAKARREAQAEYKRKRADTKKPKLPDWL